MPLSLVCGPFHPGLENALVDHLSKNPPGPSRRVTLVTPSQTLGERLQRLLALERGLSLFNLRFHTLHTLSLEILRGTAEPIPDIINDDYFHERLVEMLLREEGAYSPDRARALAGAHRSTVRDLVEAGVESAFFRDHFDDLDLPGAAKFYRILSLADRYRDRLAQLGVATSADLARRVAQIVEDRPDVLGAYDEFLYYGFYDLNAAQGEAFSAVARQARVTVFFPCVKGRAAWSFAERFLEVKLRVGGAGAAYLPVVPFGPLAPALPALFNPEGTPAEKAGPVQLVHVSGERDELWWVAKEILRLREGKKPVPWDDIGVVARGLDAYASLVPDVFGAQAIPFSLSDGGPLIGHPSAKLALDLWTISERPRDRTLLRDVLASPGLSENILSPDERESVLAFLDAADPRSGWGAFRSGATAPLPNEERNDLRPADPPAPLARVAARWSAPEEGARTWAHWAAEARRRWAEFLRRDDDTEPVLDVLAGLLDRLTALDRIGPGPTAVEFREALMASVGRARRPGTGPTGGVRVRGAMEARGERFGVLFLLGLKEGVFPRAVREDPLLPDAQRRVLRDPGGFWILPKLEGYDEEKLLFTLLVSSAEDRLYLLHSRSRDDGRAEVPSLYVRELARAAGLSWDDALRLPRPPLEKWNSVPPSLLSVQEAELADLLEGRPPLENARDLLERAGRLASGKDPGVFDGWVDRPAGYIARAAQRGLSPSALETLVNCPFEFFVSQVLGLRSHPPMFDGETIAPFFIGRVQHHLLRRVYEPFLARPLPTLESVEQSVRAETRRLFGALADPGRGPYPILWSTLERRTLAQLLAFVRRDLPRLQAEGYVPDRLEWAPPALAAMEIPWSGRVDRIDWNAAERRFRVVDYKNKPRDHSLEKRVLDGWIHQAPVYLDLVEGAAPWGPGASAAGVRFDYLAADETEEFSGELWARERNALHARQRALVTSVTEGRFAIRPTDGPQGHCALCSFARTCRKAHGATRKRGERYWAAQTQAFAGPSDAAPVP